MSPHDYIPHGTRVTATYRRWDLPARSWQDITAPATVVSYPNRPDGYVRVRTDDGTTINLPRKAITSIEERK